MIIYQCFQSYKGDTLRGLLHQGNRHIPIIVIHGFFSSNKIGPYRLYYCLADFLNNEGFSVLRVDLTSMGESDGDDSSLTFTDHVNDVVSVTEQLLQRLGEQRVHLVAHCVGCCVALASLERLASSVASISLLAPFVPSHAGFERLLGSVEYCAYQSHKPITHHGMYCDSSFIDASSIIVDIPYQQLSGHIPLKAFLPENDQMSSLDNSLSWAHRNQIPFLVIDRADHNFLDINTRESLFNAIKQYINECEINK